MRLDRRNNGLVLDFKLESELSDERVISDEVDRLIKKIKVLKLLKRRYAIRTDERNVLKIASKLYEFNTYKTKQSTTQLTFVVDDASKTLSLINSINLVFDFFDDVNAPCNVCDPSYMVQRAYKVVNELGLQDRVEVTVVQGEELRESFPLVSVVDKKTAKVLILKHKTKEEYDVCIVGKGVTFDTGGYGIKRNQSMKYMNKDMAGSAVAVASFIDLICYDPSRSAMCVCPLYTNHVDHQSYKPSEVYGSYGRSIRIEHTDAEGRLGLYDCVGYVSRYAIKNLVVVATLTGACGSFFKSNVAFTGSKTDHPKERVIKQVCKQVGSRCEVLLDACNLEHIINDPLKIADLSNTNPAESDGYHGALFSKVHWSRYEDWIHFDIANVIDSGVYKNYDVFNLISNVIRAL